MALQAVEKYLKGILLFNRESAKGLNHDICKAFARVKKVSIIDLNLASEIEQFIQVLNFKGPNRYFEWNLNRSGNELLLLDKTIWNLRIYCVALNSSAAIYEKGQEKVIWTSSEHFKKIKMRQPDENPNKIAIPFGVLEKMLEGQSEAKTALIWKNFYFGRKNKKTIQWQAIGHYSSPAHVIAPEIFAELEKFVDFSYPVREYFQPTGGTKFTKMPPAFFQLKISRPANSDRPRRLC
jgi:hypothetical protein